MSVAGISSSLFSLVTQGVTSKAQQFRKDSQQLGEDLQSGNILAAQSDYATLQQSGAQSSSNSSTVGRVPGQQQLNQLSQDLQSGKVPAAQQDYKRIQQDFRSRATAMHHHHDRGGSAESETSQLLNQMDQALQSGDTSTAQQAYSTLLQDLRQFGQRNGLDQTSTLSVTA